MQKKCKKICTCQKKAVLLHPLLMRSRKSYIVNRPIVNSFGAIAQLVEQRTENPCVPSSILGGTTKNDLKRVVFCIL